jgi:hypothetical protein
MRAIYLHGFPGLPRRGAIEAIGPRGSRVGAIKPTVVDTGAWNSSDKRLHANHSQTNVSDE